MAALPPYLVPGSDGHPIGRDPRDMTPADLAAAGMEAAPILSVIRAKCIDCSGGNTAEVRRCVTHTCALWPYRMGRNPFRTPREITEEKRAEIAERLARGRARQTGADE